MKNYNENIRHQLNTRIFFLNELEEHTKYFRLLSSETNGGDIKL